MTDSTEPNPPAPPPKGKKTAGRILSLVVVLGALALALYLITHGEHYPRTDDAYVQARYITVAAEVPGRISGLPVRDGLAVEPGELLVQIDPKSYVLAVAAATAQIEALEAQLSEAERQRGAALELVETSKANTERALAQEQLALSTRERMAPLAQEGFVTQERFDSVTSAWEQARASVLMAKSSELSAELAVPSLDTLRAELKAARVRLAQAELELERTQVRANFPGRIVNCDIAPGMMTMPGEPLFTLVDTSEWFVMANYREGDLKNIRLGDKARVRLLTLPNKTFTGEVVSIGHGVQNSDTYNFGPLPVVRNDLDWVRLAQRFPVRIRINQPEPEAAFRIGAGAVVVIE
ncbi:MAG: efflux RND transporter periplasmic adaptor subunit [Puniceicoccales bacterium]